ncbi:uncharacterized protein LOC123560833 [Mercenaria mercenaria]|uniref:uncharacterized protein LOC123560833 n=1 Tax=Mercenaria mercenaria TaxID=6596 RepID=UPI00234F4CD4|nr:uncharacterized protein LOC123560833 [Mercenaria mercenaria]
MSYNSGCLVYCIFLLLGISVAQEFYSESTEYTTWKSSTCRMAIPDIEYDDFSIDIKQKLTHDDLWLGYYRAMIGFEYFGCVKNTSVKAMKTIHIEMNSPGHCYSACGKSVQNIGLKDRECFCLDAMEPDPISESSCNLSCPAPSLNIACGGKFHLSLYRINPNVSNITETFGNRKRGSNCVRHGNTLKWDACNGSLLIMCEFGQHVVTVPVPAMSQQYFKWNVANNYCFDNNGRPVSYANALNLASSTNVSWTGMCRSFAIFSIFYDTEPANEANEAVNKEYGYLKRSVSSNEFQLHFTEKKNDKKMTLCTTGTGNRVSSSEPTNKEQADIESDKTDVSAAVGASVAAVLVIALVFVFVILRKRKKIPELCNGTPSSKDTESFDNLGAKPNEYHSYDQIGGSFSQENADSNAEASTIDNYHAHTYFVPEKQEKEIDNANETYDLAGAGKHTHAEERNHYNRVKIDNNETYDHAYNQSKDKIETHDETYDTTEKAAMKLKIGAAKNLDEFHGTDEDDYNHINGKLLKNSATDHVYGVPCQPETDTGDVGSSPQKEFQDGDTYSHIRNKPPKSYKADNLYGVHNHQNASTEID